MAHNDMEFDQRMRRLTRKHRAMSRGYATGIRSDGLIVIKPRRFQRRVSLRAVILFVAAFLVFKGFMIASLGATTYEQRVARLQSGTAAERAGAWVMQPDPVAKMVAEQIGPILR